MKISILLLISIFLSAKSFSYVKCTDEPKLLASTAPAYPGTTFRDSHNMQAGYVLVEYLIQEDGSLLHINILNSHAESASGGPDENSDYFNGSVLKALKGWKYESRDFACMWQEKFTFTVEE